MKRIARALASAGLLASLLSPIPGFAFSANPAADCAAVTTCTVSFTYTGDYYVWTVPSGVTSLTIDAYGAEGGKPISAGNTADGGKGGRVQATISVTSGETLYMYVGGAGSGVASITSNTSSAGWNGGGKGGYGNGNGWSGAGGGGATDIRTIAGNLSSRLLVAGGGGGGACNSCIEKGGAGGGTTGATGANASGGVYAGGGTQSAGGVGNTYPGWGPAANGSFGLGGDAQATDSSSGQSVISGGGGGGGGYYGGGGGSWVGGGGGSSFTHATRATSVTHTQGSRTGNGSIGITYLNSPIPTTFSTTQTSPTNIGTGSTVSYSLIMSQSVTGMATDDFQFGGTSSCNTPGLSGSGTTYTVTVTNCSEGTLILQLKAGSVTGTSSGPPTLSSANTVIIDRTAPTISSVTAPANKSYIPSETPTFTIGFSESVTITGSPRLTLTVGSATKFATFASMSDSKTALFRYTVASDPTEFDTDGISISTTLDLNSGLIRDLATNALSPLTFTAPSLTSVLVAQPPAAPTISSITPTSGQLSIAFSAGATNGSAISNYQYSTNNGGVWITRSPVATTSPIVISGLTNGTAYTVRIRAVSAAGVGDSSTSVVATPSAVVVTGNSTLTTSYGQIATSDTYTVTGGTSPYTLSLSSTPSGVSINPSTGAVTIGNTTPAGIYTQNVVATDSTVGTAQIGLKQLVITVNKASTSISISLPGSATSAAAGGTVTITATVARAGVVNFKIGGVSISGCSSATAISTSATCSWTAPGSLGSVNLSADYTPTDSSNYEISTTGSVAITVVNGVTSLTLSLTGGTTTPPKGQAINIIASIDQAGKISFFVDGKRIPGCYNINASGSSKSCSWKPAVQKRVNLTATLTPTNTVYPATTSSLAVQVVRRSGTR